MKRLLISLAVLAGAILILRRMALALTAKADGRRDTRDAPPPTRLVRDPFCHTYLPPDRAIALRGQGENGTDVWFCSDRCRSGWMAGRRAAS